MRTSLFCMLVGVALGLCIGAFAFSIFHPLALAEASCASKYPLTNAQLDCSEYEESAAKMHQLDTELDEMTDRYVKEGKATRVSVWVRDFATKQWAASNETENYAPASLLKLPLLITYYKIAQFEPSILARTLVYTHQAVLGDSIQDIPSQSTLQSGQSYTVEQLLEDMVIHSDNDAANALLQGITKDALDTTLVDIGIGIPRDDMLYEFVTVKTYANVFRMLYNSSYLDRKYSEKALEVMKKTAFPGITESIPKDISVIHKFGEREITSQDGTVNKRELHDCGIVYKEDHPYSICIMTEGKEFDTLTTIIQEISGTVYEGV